MEAPEDHATTVRGLCARLAFAFVYAFPASVSLSATAEGATHTVVMEGVAFKPEALTVKPGDTVVWVNKDLFPHTVTAQDRSFDSREIAADKSWQLAAKKSGTFPYVCTLHPTMKGTLVVR